MEIGDYLMIVSSVIVSDITQRDGFKSVHERHTDHLGKTYDITYFAPPASDTVKLMNDRVIILNDQLKQSELESIAVGDVTKLEFATANELAIFIRRRFLNSDDGETAIIAKKILILSQNGSMELLLRAAFNMTVVEWTAFKTKIQTLVNKWNDVQGAKGE